MYANRDVYAYVYDTCAFTYGKKTALYEKAYMYRFAWIYVYVHIHVFISLCLEGPSQKKTFEMRLEEFPRGDAGGDL